MSPLALRRFRAERLLRRDFQALRATVLSGVRRRLDGCGTRLDPVDLEECYAQAWQGLYATMLAGQEVLNPTGWLVQVTFRRAVEESRAAHGCSTVGDWEAAADARELDPVAQLDDRARLRHVFEGLRMRLHGRECEAASLCYLQGLSRAEAAQRMGLSELRMRKLMDGTGPDRPGVAAKVGELLGTIRAGRWCDEQASLMRGLAFGLLEHGGERHRLALAHQRQCPACRAYVASLRGLASALPPLALPVGVGAAGAAAGAGAGAAAGGGGWLLAGGSLSAKLAVGCALALGVGAGCVALTVVPPHARAARHPVHDRVARVPSLLAPSPRGGLAPVLATRAAGVAATSPPVTASAAAPARATSPRAGRSAVTAERSARREFGPEGGGAPASSAPTGVSAPPVQASAARSAPAPAPAAPVSPRTQHEFGFE